MGEFLFCKLLDKTRFILRIFNYFLNRLTEVFVALKKSAIQTVQGCFSAVERLGYRQWASNAEPTYSTGTRVIFRTDNSTGTAGYSLAKKNYPVLSELP